LAVGYLLARCWAYFQPRAPDALSAIDHWLIRGWPGVIAVRRRLAWRSLFLGISAAAAVIVTWTLVVGPMRISIGHTVLLKNGNFFRPWIVAVVFGVLGGQSGIVGRFLIVPLLMLSVLPLPTYRGSLPNLVAQSHPMRSARDCLRGVRSDLGEAASSRGLYVAGPGTAFRHEHYYYFRGLRPWERDVAPPDLKLYQYLYDQSLQRPVLVDAGVYGSFNERLASGAIPSARDRPAPPVSVKLDDAVLLLPGAYAGCGVDSAL
jgi:hypothetical protein